MSPYQILILRLSDELVAGAVGKKSHNGVTYETVAQNIAGIMPAGSDGVSHGRFPATCELTLFDLTTCAFCHRYRCRWGRHPPDRYNPTKILLVACISVEISPRVIVETLVSVSRPVARRVATRAYTTCSCKVTWLIEVMEAGKRLPIVVWLGLRVVGGGF